MSKSKLIALAAAAVALFAGVAAGTSDAEARGFGGGIRSSGFGGFRPAAASFRPIGKLPNIGNRLVGLPGRTIVKPPVIKPPKITLPTLPPKVPGNPPGLKPKPPVYGGGKGGAVAVGVAIGTGVALAASSECSYPYRMWQGTGSRAWKDRYYSCLGY